MNSYSYCSSYLCLWVRWSYDTWRCSHHTLTNMSKPILLDDNTFQRSYSSRPCVFSISILQEQLASYTAEAIMTCSSHDAPFPTHLQHNLQPPRDNATWLPLSLLQNKSASIQCATLRPYLTASGSHRESEATGTSTSTSTSTRRGVSHATNSRRG